MTYAEKLKSPKWQKRRLEILNRDKFKCKKCGDTETTLHVHHLSYHGEPWEAPSDELDTLCEHCHHFIEWIAREHIEEYDYSKIAIYRIFMEDKEDILFAAGSDGMLYVCVRGHDYQIHATNIDSIRTILNKTSKNYKDRF